MTMGKKDDAIPKRIPRKQPSFVDIWKRSSSSTEFKPLPENQNCLDVPSLRDHYGNSSTISCNNTDVETEIDSINDTCDTEIGTQQIDRLLIIPTEYIHSGTNHIATSSLVEPSEIHRTVLNYQPSKVHNSSPSEQQPIAPKQKTLRKWCSFRLLTRCKERSLAKKILEK